MNDNCVLITICPHFTSFSAAIFMALEEWPFSGLACILITICVCSSKNKMSKDRILMR
jgi:hypothetical protein